MRPKIAIYGGSFNPPSTHHRLVAEALIPHFDKIIVLPCGLRPDILTSNDVDPWHRAALTDTAFKGLPKVEVDLSDLELASFTTNDQLEARYGHLGDLWHVLGCDPSEGNCDGESVIAQDWERGTEMWTSLNFCVVTRHGYKVNTADLPPNHTLIELGQCSSGSSAEIREKIFKRTPYTDLVTEGVAAYIERYGLYRGRIPARRARWKTEHPQLLIVADERNPRAVSLARTYSHWEDADNPTCILVLGGDGTMLHAIRKHWRRRVPFLGVNQGHLGFLLNEPEALLAHDLPKLELIVRQMPMLYVEVETADGIRQNALAFNDAWIERSSSQSAWIEVSVNDQIRIRKLVADGALVCTAGGSTAYARSMGVAPLLADTPGWILVGSNVMTPPGWKSALLASEATVVLRSVGGDKRPLCAFIDGRAVGPVTTFYARQSRVATIEIAFAARHDMAEKIARIQFPSLD
ncbi:MAG: kinase [Chthoniobacteraceae bacterium]|nr:kinase [Chthoniobacteraceae bacterium]